MSLEEYKKPTPELDTPEHFLRKFDKAKNNLGTRPGPYLTWLEGEHADTSVYKPFKEDLSNGVPNSSHALNDLTCGIACVGGKPNYGKSTLFVSWMMSLLKLHKDVIVLDFSFDDPFEKRLTQYVANLGFLRYDQITTSIELHPAEQNRRDAAYAQINEWINTHRLKTYESTEIFQLEGGSSTVRRIRSYRNMLRAIYRTRENYPDAKIVAFVDSWSNLDFTDIKAQSELTQSNVMLEEIHEIVGQCKVIMMASVHLRKFDRSYRLPTLDDLKGNGSVAYDAIWTSSLINETKEGYFDKPMTFDYEGETYPIIQLMSLKNKVSGHEAPIFYKLYRDRCSIAPLTKEEYFKYSGILKSEREGKK